jgi:hypothetical protein
MISKELLSTILNRCGVKVLNEVQTDLKRKGCYLGTSTTSSEKRLEVI